MSGNGRRVRIFGRDEFVTKWVVQRRGWLNHTFLCDGQVAVHDSWWERGYRHAVLIGEDVDRASMLAWLQDKYPGNHLVHPGGAVLFALSTAPSEMLPGMDDGMDQEWGALWG